jgi:hypothetical protein
MDIETNGRHHYGRWRHHGHFLWVFAGELESRVGSVVLLVDDGSLGGYLYCSDHCRSDLDRLDGKVPTKHCQRKAAKQLLNDYSNVYLQRL